MVENQDPKCYEGCENYEEGSCRYEEWLGTGRSKKINLGDKCFFPAQRALNSLNIPNPTDVTEENQDSPRTRQLSLRENIGIGVQVTGLTAMLGGALGHAFQSNSSSTALYVAIAGLFGIFSGSFIRSSF